MNGLNTTTCFQIFSSEVTDDGCKIIDFTERKLLKLFERATSEKRRLELGAAIDAYRNRTIAIGWKSSEPTYVNVTSERDGKSSDFDPSQPSLPIKKC